MGAELGGIVAENLFFCCLSALFDDSLLEDAVRACFRPEEGKTCIPHCKTLVPATALTSLTASPTYAHILTKQGN